MAMRRASLVAQFSAKTNKYNRAILKATRENKKFTDSSKKMGKAGKKSGEELSKAKKIFKRVATVVALVTVAIKLLIPKILKLSDASSRLEEIQQKFNIVFRNSRNAVNKWAEEFSISIRRNSTDVKKYAAQLQNTFVPLGFMREEATKLSQAIVELGFDLSSFNDIPTDRVLTDLQSALMGNVRAVRKYGISANETAIFAEALRQGWVREKKEIDGVIKARAINNIIMRATKDAQGDLARTLEQTANIRREYNSTIVRTKELLGDYVNDYLTPLRRWISKIATGWNEALASLRNYQRAMKGQLINTKFEDAIERQEELIQKVNDEIAVIKERDFLQLSGAGVSRQLSAEARGRIIIKEYELDLLETELLYLRDLKRIQEEREADTRAQAILDEQEANKQKEADDALAYRKTLLMNIADSLRVVEEKNEIALETEREYNAVKERAKVIDEALNQVIQDGSDDRASLIQLLLDQYGELIVNNEQLLYWEEQLELARKSYGEAEDEREKAFLDGVRDKAKASKDFWDALIDDIIRHRDVVRNVVADEKQAYKDFFISLPTFAMDAFSAISNLTQAMVQREIALFNFSNEAKDKARDEDYKKEKKRIEDQLTDKYFIDKELAEYEEQFAQESLDLEEDTEKARRKLIYEGALQSWKLQILQTIAAGAQAQIASWTSPTALLSVKIATASLAAITAGISLAAVRASKPIKNFRTGTRGFTVPEGFNNDSFGIGLSSGEKVTVETGNQQADANNELMQNIYFIMDSRQVGHVVNKGLHNRNIIIRPEDISS